MRRLIMILAACACVGAHAQSFPQRSLRIIVPFPAGGTADATTRIIAERLTQAWSQPVIIDNRPGAGGNIGAEILAKAEPNGYTLMSSPVGPVAANQFLYPALAYDPMRFVAISLINTTVSVLATRSTLPAKTVQEVIALAQAQPGKISYASQGNGSTSHLTAVMFQQASGTSMLHVPYKGSAPALVDLIGGQVDLFFDNISSAVAHHRAGKLRILATAGLQRSATVPDLPTIQEAGLPGFTSLSWNVIVGPEGLPDAIATRISEAVRDALKLPEIQAKYREMGADPVGASPAETARFIADERARWRKVIEGAKLRVE